MGCEWNSTALVAIMRARYNSVTIPFVICACFALAFLSKPLIGRVDRVTSLWRTGFVGGLCQNRRGESSLILNNPCAGILFLDNEKLATYTLEFRSGELSSREDPRKSSSYAMQVNILAAKSGEQISSHEWGTRLHEYSVQRLSDGLLIQNGRLLDAVSTSLAPLKEIDVREENIAATWDKVKVSTSVTGHTLLINKIDQKRRVSHFDVIQWPSLKLEYSWEQSPPLYFLYSISDSGILASCHNQECVQYRGFDGGGWHQIGPKLGEGCVGSPASVSDQVVAYTCQGLSVLSLGGNTIMKVAGVGGQIAVSQDGRTVAVSAMRVRGRDWWDTSKGIRITERQVRIYDIYLNRELLSVDVTPLSKSIYDFALSPNGTRLAILNDRSLSLYAVPPSGSR